MNSYVVRVYRREKRNPKVLVGVVELVGTGRKKAFTTFEELWEILNGTKVGRAGRRKISAAS